MASILTRLSDTYTYALEEGADPRVADWFLMQSPLPILGLIVFYFSFVVFLGPILMKNKQPLKLDNILKVYNALQIVTCSFIVYVFVTSGYDILCAPIDHTSDHGLLVARTVWLYLMLKIVDILDTVFFVLRKKQNQISFLHVSHHAGMIFNAWAGCKFVPGGYTLYIVGANSFVHVVMYGYYFLTVWNPELRKSLWWKKHLTQLQLFQFISMMFQQLLILLQPNCEYPKRPLMLFTPQGIVLVYLFLDFYKKAYMTPQASEVNNLLPKKEKLQ